MDEDAWGVAVFACLLAASLGSLALQRRYRSRRSDDETVNVVRLTANVFVVMTSLILGLLINSAKNTLDSVDRNVHAFAAGLIMLDRWLQHYGADADGARQRLLAYAKHAGLAIRDYQGTASDREGERMLNDVGAAIDALKPADPERRALVQSAQQQFVRISELRWLIVGTTRGTIPAPLVALVVACLMLVFASYAWRAPSSAAVIASFLVASLLLTAAIVLILDMDRPFTGPVRVSADPLLRAALEMQH
nr:hypothetical protein [Caldimonas sp.]